MTFTEHDANQLASIVVDTIKLAITPLYERIMRLEAQHAAKGDVITYAGTYRADMQYARGAVVTRNHRRFIAVVDGASSDPGKPDDARREWRLFEDAAGKDAGV